MAKSQLSDAQLVDKYVAGDENALAILIDRHQSKKDVQTSDEKPSTSKSKKSTKVEEPLPPKSKKAPSAVKPKKSKKVQSHESESDQ